MVPSTSEAEVEAFPQRCLIAFGAYVIESSRGEIHPHASTDNTQQDCNGTSFKLTSFPA